MQRLAGWWRMLYKGRSIVVCYWVALETELLAIFGGHEVLMATGQRESIAGLKLSKSVGVGVGGSARFRMDQCEAHERPQSATRGSS